MQTDDGQENTGSGTTPKAPVAQSPVQTVEEDRAQTDAAPEGNGAKNGVARRTHERWRFSRELNVFDAAVTLISALTVVFLIDQARQTRIALNEVRRQFIVSQRPYITVSAEMEDLLTTPDAARVGPVWKISYRNHGPSPAIRVGTVAKLYVGKAALSDASEFFRNLPEHFGPGDGFIVPETSAGTRSYMTLHISGEPAPYDTYKAMLEKDDMFVAAGRIVYEDLFGDRYRTDFCYSRLATGALMLCTEHNNIR